MTTFNGVCEAASEFVAAMLGTTTSGLQFRRYFTELLDNYGHFPLPSHGRAQPPTLFDDWDKDEFTQRATTFARRNLSS